MASAVAGGVIGGAVGALAGLAIAGLRNDGRFGMAAGIGAALGVLGGAVVAVKVAQPAASSNQVAANSGVTSSTTGLPPEEGSTTPTVD